MFLEVASKKSLFQQDLFSKKKKKGVFRPEISKCVCLAQVEMLASVKRGSNFYLTSMFGKEVWKGSFYSAAINKFENLNYIENIER